MSAVSQQVLLAPGAVSHLRLDTRLRAAPRQVLTLRDLLALTLYIQLINYGGSQITLPTDAESNLYKIYFIYIKVM